MHRLAAPILLLALAGPALADTVYLANGNKFEQVAAEERDGQVRIRMPDGEIVLPARVVARVEPSRSAWQEFGERRRRLTGERSTAEAWLELARWADEAGFERGLRQAALRAAQLAPRLEGLEPLMRRLGYTFDPDSGAWLSEKEYMERRGFVLWGDRWLPREAYLARLEERQERASRRREEARQERITRAIEALAVAELRRAAEPEPEPQGVVGGGPVVAAFPGTYFPVIAGVGHPVTAAPARRAAYQQLSRRQPGSLMPIRPQPVAPRPAPPPPRHLASSD